MYEHRTARLLTREQFLRRLLRHGGLVAVLIGGSLIAGMVGYHVFAQMSWIDSFLNACMLLGGMGPVGDLPNDEAKIFAGAFALYAGLVFVLSAGILLAPIAHRILHKLHLGEH